MYCLDLKVLPLGHAVDFFGGPVESIGSNRAPTWFGAHFPTVFVRCHPPSPALGRLHNFGACIGQQTSIGIGVLHFQVFVALTIQNGRLTRTLTITFLPWMPVIQPAAMDLGRVLVIMHCVHSQIVVTHEFRDFTLTTLPDAVFPGFLAKTRLLAI